MSRFVQVHKRESPCLYCHKCRHWRDVTRQEAYRTHVRVWTCPGCKGEKNGQG